MPLAEGVAATVRGAMSISATAATNLCTIRTSVSFLATRSRSQACESVQRQFKSPKTLICQSCPWRHPLR